MKIRDDIDLVEKCLQNIKEAQEILYKRFAPKMFGVCMRYAKDKMEAEDFMQEGFIKVFYNLQNFRNEGSLEGWVRRTMVHTSINFYRKNLKFSYSHEETDMYENNPDINPDQISSMSANELLKVIQGLPEVYRMVFNLYVVEGYSHKEIGEILEIPENTSKSQLMRARKLLQDKLKGIRPVFFSEKTDVDADTDIDADVNIVTNPDVTPNVDTGAEEEQNSI
ncbi:MAG: sigma-70 family RNA polymerase sigma factor [Bacteroidales bacterium]|nr:sigma-70 family RNA polymerase sigma factor [Bacteroidales bacterium]